MSDEKMCLCVSYFSKTKTFRNTETQRYSSFFSMIFENVFCVKVIVFIGHKLFAFKGLQANENGQCCIFYVTLD